VTTVALPPDGWPATEKVAVASGVLVESLTALPTPKKLVLLAMSHWLALVFIQSRVRFEVLPSES
jgi:hypothetical protein